MNRSTAKEVLPYQMVMSGVRVPFSIRKNARARRVWIKMEDQAGLVLVLPRWASPSNAPEILRRHKDWILKRLSEREERLSKAAPPLGSCRTLVYRGRPLPLRVRNCACSVPFVEWHQDHVMVNVPKGQEPPLTEILETSYREKAREVLLRRVLALAELLQVHPKKVQVRDQKTRWGACTGRGTLTFSWRLILAPPAVLDYVVVHELCHLRHANHSRRFWDLVSQACPQFAAHRAWLRENGALIKTAAQS